MRLLILLLTVWEPVNFAVAASGAFNAISVRGWPVVLVLVARLAATTLGVAAGRALADRRPSAPALTKTALCASATVQVFALLTPYFPSNLLPGQTPLFLGITVVYYGAWFAYVQRSRHVAVTYN